jgi:hypothetical protein
MSSPTRGDARLCRPFKDISMAQYSNVPPPDDPGRLERGRVLLSARRPSPSRSPARHLLVRRSAGLGVPERAPPGQFLPFLLGGLARMPRPTPPGQFLASIGVPPPQPMSISGDGRLPMSPLEKLLGERQVPPLPLASTPDRARLCRADEPDAGHGARIRRADCGLRHHPAAAAEPIQSRADSAAWAGARALRARS